MSLNLPLKHVPFIDHFDFNAIYCIGYVHATLGSQALGGH